MRAGGRRGDRLIAADPAAREGRSRAARLAAARAAAEFVRSLCQNQGKRLSSHGAFTVGKDIQLDFCDPHSPWQRGANENTNGRLRRHIPKGTELSLHAREDLERFARSLNNRTRVTLGFTKASAKPAGRVAMTD